MRLEAEQRDRAIGSVAAAACGDALGSQYEFQTPIGEDEVPEFGFGTFGHRPGEWTDDTAMAAPILLRLSEGGSFADEASYNAVLRQWVAWSRDAKDVGIQTRQILGGLGADATEAQARILAESTHKRTGKSAGNGSLMRTGPLALGYLDDGQEAELAAAAARLARLTHWDDDNAAACALWCLAIRHAVRTGEFDVPGQVQFLPAAWRSRWAGLVAQALAESMTPADFAATNGWVVSALQASVAAINSTDSLLDALYSAIRGGNDTDTIAAITGALAGAIYGKSALPDWDDAVFGWPGVTLRELLARVDVALGDL